MGRPGDPPDLTPHKTFEEQELALINGIERAENRKIESEKNLSKGSESWSDYIPVTQEKKRIVQELLTHIYKVEEVVRLMGMLALKRKTGQSDAELFLIGRDVDAAEYALKYHPDIWIWKLLGNAEEVKATQNLQATYNAIKESEKALKPKEIAEISGVKYWTVTANLKSLIQDGSIKKTDYGEYKT